MMCPLHRIVYVFLMVKLIISTNNKEIDYKDIEIIPALNENYIHITYGSCNKFYPEENSDIFYKI
jgi:hypothetical protein